MNEEIRIGDLVSIEGSDTLWQVLDIDKGFLDLENAEIEIIKLYSVPQDEVLGVVED